MLKREDIRIRDPFILTDAEKGCYYMYGRPALSSDDPAVRATFSVYVTRDLENFEEPKIVLDARKIGFWGTDDFWAPEVHLYRDRYYLFGTCRAEGMHRATQIFVSDTPDGEFVPLSPEARTPYHWECLDGTLWIEDGVPYMVFCREWLEVKDGEMWAMPLADDLTHPVGEPVLLFRASQATDVREHGKEGSGDYITDGPFLYREGDALRMIWSSFGGKEGETGRYLVLCAVSEGGVCGPWKHLGSRYDFDGGHAMLFKTLTGEEMIALHSPNVRGPERAKFFRF